MANKKKILDVVSISGSSVKEFEGERGYLSTGDLDFNKIANLEMVTYENKPSRANQNVNIGEVIFAKMKDTKKTLVIDDSNKDMIVSTGFYVLKPSKEILSKYLYHYLNSDYFLNQKNKLSKGATQCALNNEGLANIDIYIQSLETQKKIVEVLDKAEELIGKRKEQIEVLDELVRSKFIYMFGDPAFNPMNWKVVDLNFLLREKASNGFFAKNDEYKDKGNAKVMWLGDIINRRYSNTEELKQVDVTDITLNKYRVTYGDLLFCRSSLNKDGIGKSSAVPMGVEDNIMFECHIIRTPLDLSKCVPEFIQIQSTMNYFRNQIMSKSKTATMTTIGQDGIITTKVILPPLELQKVFVDFVYQVDKLKSQMETSLKELEDNFNSLMQKAFKGELF